MTERQFTEIDLRRMLQLAIGLREDILQGRWIVEARHQGAAWEIVVEPDREFRLIVIITAYQAE